MRYVNSGLPVLRMLQAVVSNSVDRGSGSYGLPRGLRSTSRTAGSAGRSGCCARPAGSTRVRYPPARALAVCAVPAGAVVAVPQRNRTGSYPPVGCAKVPAHPATTDHLNGQDQPLTDTPHPIGWVCPISETRWFYSCGGAGSQSPPVGRVRIRCANGIGLSRNELATFCR